ncbi:hypothetical protein RF11_00796 [Thelohanellus kitauei]|uniref:ISXO2-like transposase domain-containing protein n=1 Tax=Thelohanellus kitauei TaxID=669202 RepID=A0A0C2N5G0_THEKT|nr:hypothetical protein RF11_00796 [Thelohanellus kitauei]
MYVQIDEIGRILANQDLWIRGGIDEAAQIFMEITTRRNRKTLTEIITSNVEPGSAIQTDGWAAYRWIQLHNYVHEVVIHHSIFVSDEGITTNRIESTGAM